MFVAQKTMRNTEQAYVQLTKLLFVQNEERHWWHRRFICTVLPVVLKEKKKPALFRK